MTLSIQETIVDWAVKWQKETFKESFTINWTMPVFDKGASHTHTQSLKELFALFVSYRNSTLILVVWRVLFLWQCELPFITVQIFNRLI